MAMVMENQQPLAPPMPAPPLPPPPPPPLPPPLLPQAYKHRCKVCKKGFMCGRALGGHMRAHGITDDGLSADDDDAALDNLDDDDDDDGPCSGGGGGGGAWDSSEAAAAGAATATTKRMYSLRTNAGRHKNCRVCENCGKVFTSWKSLLDHGRCSFDRGKDDDLTVAGAGGADVVEGEDEEEDLALAAGGWSKGKRTRRTKVIVVENGSPVHGEQPLPATSREEEDLANCLVMLASSRGGCGVHVQTQAIVDVVHRQAAHESTSKDEERAPAASKDDKNFFAPPPQPISMLPPNIPQFKFLAPPQVMMPSSSPAVPRGLFECKACKKVFTSHQALGGHRASHKKVKGCFAAKLDESSRNDSSPQPAISAAAASPSDNVRVVVEAIPAAAIVGTTTKSSCVDGDNAELNNMVNAARTTAVVATTSAQPEMAIVQVDEAPSSSSISPFKKKGKVHECSICHRVFMSGQALGGHKRCHWLTTGAAAGDPTAVSKLPFVTQEHVMAHAAMCQQLTLGPPMFDSYLDLNVSMNQSADPAATRHAAAELNESMLLSLNAPAASLYMHSWAGHTTTNGSNMHNTAAATSGHYDDLQEAAATEDEADSGTSAKRAKMSDLKDMNISGETSPWLQVGIALQPSENNERLLKHNG